MNNSRHSFTAGRFGQVAIVCNTKLSAQVLWADEGQQDYVGVHTAHEDTDDQTVLVSLGLSFGRQWESFADRTFNGRASTTDQVTELVGSSNHERPERPLFMSDAVRGSDES